MVELLAVQSIDRKLQMKRSVIVGNYEFYYASGLLSAKTTLDGNGETKPTELKEKVEAALTQYAPANDEDAYLVKLLQRYIPTQEPYDTQMQELFAWGKTGQEPKK